MITHEELWSAAFKARTEKTKRAAKDIEFLVIQDNINVVAFRGMEPSFTKPTDIITCLRAWPRPTHGGVHSGIWSAAKAASGKVRKTIKPDRPLALTGFSMGGAIALFCSEILEEFQVIECVTFGSPKVLRKPENFTKNITQYIYSKDIVPHFPGRFWNYKHVNPVVFGKGSSYSWTYHDMGYYYERFGAGDKT